MTTIISAAVGSLVASVALVALPAGATTAATAFAPDVSGVVINRDAPTPILRAVVPMGGTQDIAPGGCI